MKRARVISVIVPSRIRGAEAPQGAEALAALEALIVEAAALAGVDAEAPMRRDVATVLRPRRHRRS